MTKKDYILLAKAISKNSNEDDTIANVVYSIANALQHDNPKFDYDKFISACGKAVL